MRTVMGEVGESSGTRHSEEIWAKLVPSDSGYSEVVLSSDEIVICSEIKSSGLDKRKWCKISRNPDLCCATIQNMSPNAILVNEVVVENEDTIVIKCGSEIIAGPDREGYLSYKFEVMPGPEICKKQVKIAIDADDAKCSICLNIWHDVVTVAPCLHNFCNGCFSEWLRRSQEKHSRVLCPHCRAVVQFIGRNHFLHKIVEDVIEADSSLKRSDEEVALLDSYASIKSNLVIKSRKNLSRKRAHSLVDEESDGIDLSCLQCDTELGGFHCNENTVHLQCQGCGGIMPSRSDIGVPQHCVGCDRTFCGAYWHAQRLTTSEFYPICSHETFVPISDRTISRLPDAVHERNRHEQDITERCIIQMGRTLQDVISDWTAKLDNREIDRTNMPLKHAEMVSAATHVCNGCYEKLVSFLLYWFRISLPKSLLPPDASKREDCWYGYACRTQHHSEEHARKRNHVCRPTRGY